MFGNVGWSEILVLLVASLVILGPERLPGAVSWVAKSLRQVRQYATGAASKLKEDFGDDFDEFREPLNQLNQLRGVSPRAMITKHLLDGDDSLLTGKFDKPQTPPGRDFDRLSFKPLAPGETPPIDSDAT